MNKVVTILIRLVVLTLILLTSFTPAQARIYFGIGVPLPYFGPPVYYPHQPSPYYAPPSYYAPPPYYAEPPPPVMYTPQPSYSGQSCIAGPYVCPLERPMPPGAGCYCTGNQGQRIGGRVD